MSNKYVPPHRRNKDSNTPTFQDHQTDESRPRANQPEISRSKPITKDPQVETVVPEAIQTAVESVDEWALERRLFTELAHIREEHEQRQAMTEFNDWVDYYGDELQLIYNQCVPPNFPLSYARFVQLAYQCTAIELDHDQSKYIHHLV